MAAYFVNEGELLFANMLLKNITTDRQANLELLLFTNATVNETTVYADLVEPTGGSYARKTLTDSAWTESNGIFSYAPQTFTPVGSGFTGDIQGAAIVTKGVNSKILFIVTDPTAPVKLTVGTPYVVALNIACSSATKGNRSLMLDILLKRNLSARGTDLKCVLFTNAIAEGTATTLTDLQQPTGGNYAPVDVLDSSWTIVNSGGDSLATVPALTFTPTDTTYNAPIAGYALVTKSAPNNIVSIELDPTQPVDIPLNTPYLVTPQIKVM